MVLKLAWFLHGVACSHVSTLVGMDIAWVLELAWILHVNSIVDKCGSSMVPKRTSATSYRSSGYCRHQASNVLFARPLLMLSNVRHEQINEISVAILIQCFILYPSTNETEANRMKDLISKLSKIDQRNVKMALIHATTGNTRSLDSMVRAANSRSHATLAAIRALV